MSDKQCEIVNITKLPDTLPSWPLAAFKLAERPNFTREAWVVGLDNKVTVKTPAFKRQQRVETVNSVYFA
jgi:hypothetical protein